MTVEDQALQDGPIPGMTYAEYTALVVEGGSDPKLSHVVNMMRRMYERRLLTGMTMDGLMIMAYVAGRYQGRKDVDRVEFIVREEKGGRT